MTWRSHVLLGIGSLWLIAPLPGAITTDDSLHNLGLLSAAAALGALLPDLDAPASKIKSLSVSIGNLHIEPFAVPAHGLSRTLGHRGLLHSLLGLVLFGLIVCLPLALFNIGSGSWGVSLAILLGYASHLGADACTRTGIPLLYPKRQRFFLSAPYWRLVTGGPVESRLLPLLALPGVLLLVWRLFALISWGVSPPN